MDSGRRQSLSWSKILGWLMSLVALVFVGRWLVQLDSEVWSQLGQLNRWFLVLSLGLFLSWFWLRFLAWKRISLKHGYQGDTAKNIRFWALSEFMRYIPGNVWSFAARWKGSVRGGVSKASATQALIIEALGLIGGAALIAGTLAQPDWWWIGLIGLAAYFIMAPQLLPWAWRRLKVENVTTVSSAELLGLILLYALTWTMFGLATAAVYYSFPEPPVVQIVQLVGISVLSWLLGYLSIITPMGLGVREAAMIVLLGPIVGNGFASLITVVSRVWLVVSELVFLSLVLLKRQRL